MTTHPLDAARVRWERAVEDLRELSDPTSPRYRGYSATAPWVVRETAKREQTVRMARLAYDELAARYADHEVVNPLHARRSFSAA